jgi:hypothetical protein
LIKAPTTAYLLSTTGLHGKTAYQKNQIDIEQPFFQVADYLCNIHCMGIMDRVFLPSFWFNYYRRYIFNQVCELALLAQTLTQGGKQ